MKKQDLHNNSLVILLIVLVLATLACSISVGPVVQPTNTPAPTQAAPTQIPPAAQTVEVTRIVVATETLESTQAPTSTPIPTQTVQPTAPVIQAACDKSCILYAVYASQFDGHGEQESYLDVRVRVKDAVKGKDVSLGTCEYQENSDVLYEDSGEKDIFFRCAVDEAPVSAELTYKGEHVSNVFILWQ